ncbi:MAG TPA: non-ribosomal peptide synthetase, partial [Thermoanaerobaculia bacterium]|nr:non-ribosomal peptide synthetase [Thermoanaerobaculia bacterium]
PATRGLAKGWGGRLIEVGEEGERRGAAALDSPATEGEDLAYLVYTSGSTGRPKGVMVPQRGLANRLGWDLETGVWEPGDRLAQLTSASFDVSLWELLAPLAAGIRLELGPAEITRDPRTLATWLGERRITAFSGVPTLLAALVEEEPFAAAPLRALFIGGEAMPPELPGRVWSLSPARIFNMYGPTETSIDATLRECVVSERNVPIGRPLARLCALVVDGEFEPQPLGVPGELAVGGPSLALGYFRQPAATAERFVPDPTSAAPGERLYRTGDRARWLASGELEFLGRLDQQIKLRGVRIELAEIEARLGQHPAVAQAAVSLSRRAASPRLFACWVPRAGGAPPASEELRRFLARSLPEAMVPSAFLALEALPLLPNGKVDRRALPEPEEPGAAARDLGGPLRSPLEEVLGGIWCEVLGVPRVGPRSHFFELGGHSLLATRVAARSAELFGVELPLKTLFSAPTLGELAGEIQRALGPG